MTENVSGLILLNKSAGLTSFRTLGILKKKLGTKKVGHTGTLDSFATGLMIILTGSFTRLAQFYTDMDKEYEAVVSFGSQTDTLDPTGDVVAEGGIPSIESIRSQIGKLTGTIDQVPPMFSAIHIDGKRAYKRTLAGEEVAMPSRRVTIHALEILDYQENLLSIRVRCSKGTYIRSIARDIGKLCGSAAPLQALCRTKVGRFSLEQAVTADAFQPTENLLVKAAVLEGLPNLILVAAKNEHIDDIRQGKVLRPQFFTTVPLEKDCLMGLHDEKFELLAVAEKHGENFNYKMVIPH